MKQLPIYQYAVSLDYIDIEKMKSEYHSIIDDDDKTMHLTYYLHYQDRVERFLLQDCNITCYAIDNMPWKGEMALYFYYQHPELPSAFAKLNAVVEHKEKIENYTLKHKTLKDFDMDLYKRDLALISTVIKKEGK